MRVKLFSGEEMERAFAKALTDRLFCTQSTGCLK